MPLLRLIGLALFITAIFLALAAAITKTTHIRIQSQGAANVSQSSATGGSMVFPPPSEPSFTSVPIVWPLVIAASAGLLMWFILSSEPQRASNSYKQRSRRQR